MSDPSLLVSVAAMLVGGVIGYHWGRSDGYEAAVQNATPKIGKLMAIADPVKLQQFLAEEMAEPAE